MATITKQKTVLQYTAFPAPRREILVQHHVQYFEDGVPTDEKTKQKIYTLEMAAEAAADLPAAVLNKLSNLADWP